VWYSIVNGGREASLHAGDGDGVAAVVERSMEEVLVDCADTLDVCSDVRWWVRARTSG
jgi:hypothetical protein